MIACRKCRSTDLFTVKQGTQTGLYCSECDAWQKWVGKDELKIVEQQIQSNKSNLSQFSDEELLQEIGRRLKEDKP